MFQKLVSFTKKVADLADKPALNASELKSQFDAAPDEVRVYLNNLIDALKKTETGDSGAKNIGATSISGLTGTDVQTILESLKTYSDSTFAKKSQDAWQNITLVNSWANYGSPFANAQYRKNQLGEVRVKGFIKGGNTTEGYVVFTLPTGYRPPSDEMFDLACYNNTVKSQATLRISASTGNVQVDSVPANSWLNLSGIAFYVD